MGKGNDSIVTVQYGYCCDGAGFHPGDRPNTWIMCPKCNLGTREMLRSQAVELGLHINETKCLTGTGDGPTLGERKES